VQSFPVASIPLCSHPGMRKTAPVSIPSRTSRGIHGHRWTTDADEDFSTARIARYFSLVEEMDGGEAVVVITKAGLRQPGDEEFFAELAEAVDTRAKVLLIS